MTSSWKIIMSLLSYATWLIIHVYIYKYIFSGCRRLHHPALSILWGFMRLIFILNVTALTYKATVPFYYVWTLSYRLWNCWLYLNSYFILIMTWSPNSIIVINYCIVFANHVFFNPQLFTLTYKSPIS